MMKPVAGIDVGGTFTDLVLLDVEGRITLGKVPSTPANQAIGIMVGLTAAVKEIAALDRVTHGTTISTNAILEGSSAEVALVTTPGFADTLEIGRTRRMLPSLYDPGFVRPPPLVPRPLRLEVPGRMAADGSVIDALDEDAVKQAARRIDGRAKAIAVCFLHSWRDAAYEQRAAEILRAVLPGTFVTTSAEVVPEFREYERFSTTVVNAGLLPVMDSYLETLNSALAEAGCPVLLTMSSAGGTLDVETVRRLPVRTILSGPAGGVAGALWIAKAAELDRFITCDMGGTSTDVCVVEGGRPAVVSETTLAGYPLKGLQYHINTVGAGGGSIAYAEADGILQVGPRSAGAEPGPACYGRSGVEPTVTDANLVLGRLGTERLLGGAIRLDCNRARRSMGKLAGQLGLGIEQLAEGILELVVARMAAAIRVITVERGRYPADFVLLPFGGAGAMHGCELAEQLHIRQILVPTCPGNLSALGLVTSDQRQELVRTCLASLENVSEGELAGLLHEQEANGRQLPLVTGMPVERVRFEHAFDMRYARQAFEITVPLDAVTRLSAQSLRERFLELYRQLYGQAHPHGAIEIVNLRTMVVGLIDKPAPQPIAPATAPARLVGRRRIWRAGKEEEWPVYWRDSFGAGNRVAGPAVVEEANATTVLLPAWTLSVDGWGNLQLMRKDD